MVGLTSEQRQMLLDKVPDTANLVLGTLAFGQLLSDEPFSAAITTGGFVVWGLLFGWAFRIGGKRG